MVLISTLFIGCNNSKDKIDDKNNAKPTTNTQLSSTDEKIVTDEYNNLESQEDNLLRREFESSFAKILHYIDTGNTEELKKIVTKNITVEKNKIINNRGSKKEFTIPEAKIYYLPRCYTYYKTQKKFNIAYEMHVYGNIEFSDKTEVLYVEFIDEDGTWKLNGMEIDIN